MAELDSEMAESTPVVSVNQVPGPAEQRSRGFGHWLFRTALRPISFVRSHPGRAALYFALIAILATAAAALGVWIWYDRHLREAKTELERGHHAAAARHLQQCHRVRSEGHDVLLLSARLARMSGSWDEAESLLGRFSKLYGDEDDGVLEQLLLRAVRGETNAVGPQLRARIKASIRWADASRELLGWLHDDPESTAAMLLQGKLEEQRQGFEVAIGLYRRILELDPEHDEARMRLASQLLATRRGDEALPHIEVLRRHLPDHPEVAVQWVQVLALTGRTDESRAALEECIRAHPDYAPALVERGGVRLLQGREPEAEEDFARAVLLDPGNLVARNQFAFALARNGKQKEAAEARAAAERLKADLEEISKLIVGRLQTNPSDPDVHYEIGMIAFRSGLVKEAIQWFTSALQLDPNHVPSHRMLAVVYHEIGNPVLEARHRAFAQGTGQVPNK